MQTPLGVFQEYYITHQLRDKPPDDISWIGSLAAFLQFAIGAVAGPLFDRYGSWIIRPASLLYVFAMMMTSLCDQYWHFVLVQGVLMGCSIGLLLFPSISAVSQYFDKKRGAALGLVVAGSSIGGIVFPIALSRLLNASSLGFGWSLRIIGFVTMPLLSFSCVVIKARLPPRKTKFFLPAAFKQADFSFLVLSLFFMFLGMFTPLFYIPSYAVSRGINSTLASYLLAILNGASTFGRIIPGILSDKVGKLNMLSIGSIITGVVIFCMTKAESVAGLVLYSIAIGFFSGTLISGASAALSICPEDPRDMGTLIGPPVNGILIRTSGGYLQLSILSGVMCLVGGVICFLTKLTTPKGLLGKT
ncbi:major facilitator superfamily domain-containing protein [Exophiala viscosa]|uniref:major facilitator superfamily domain-containing protein n=1 Tax=Exophiala viscosa TaxID=2486360 RepID=UPI0021907727|nr:major facilitator superfamily domain-containing protein [Exophiala viscosa]